MRYADRHLEAKVFTRGDSTTASLDGELDRTSQPVLRALVAAMVLASPRSVTIAVDGVIHADAAGLRGLAGAVESLQLAGATVRLTGLGPLGRRVVAQAGLDVLEDVAAPPLLS